MTLITSKADSVDIITAADMNTVVNKIQTTNATNVDFNTSFARVFNVKNYGAIGNGTIGGGTDDTSAIQAALNACRYKPGTVYFPYGTYKVSSSLTFASYTAMIGDVTYSPAILAANNLNGPILKNADRTGGVVNVTIRGMRFEGNSAGQTSGGGIDIFRGDGLFSQFIRIFECYINDTKGTGISFTNVQEAHIVNNIVLSPRSNAAIAFKASPDNIISGNQIGGGGIVADGISMISSSDHNLISNNFIYTSNRGIISTGSRRTVFAGNRVNTNNSNGIDLEGSGVADCIVNGNQIYDNGQTAVGARAGVLIYNTANVIVFGNRCMDTQAVQTQQAGIRFDGTSAFCLISQNDLRGNASLALQNTGTSASNLFADNVGYNPAGLATFTINTSPYTYTNLDNVYEMIYVTGGTMSSFVKNGITLFSATPAYAFLAPNESVKVVYSVTPNGVKDRK